VPRPKYHQPVIDLIYSSAGCVRRHVIVEFLMAKFGLTKEQARTVAKQVLRSLVRNGVVVRKGRGYYCRAPVGWGP
jgi:hypothetical protein